MVTNRTIRQLIKEVIEETYKGQKDLEKFTNDILLKLGDAIVREREHLEFLDKDSPELRFFPMMFTGTMKGEGYDEIGDFVDDTSIKIIPTTTIGGSEGTKGQLAYGRQDFGHSELFEIRLKYSQNDIDEINELFNEKAYGEVKGRDVYFKIYYMFYSVLLHEIQHAYDAWRSKGKAFGGQLKKSYISSRQKASNLARSKNINEFTPEEIKAISDSDKAYQNLVHEINARFAQAMHRIRITTIDDNWDDIMNPWKGVYSSFKFEFDGWRNLSDKMKKKLTRRLAKAYQESSENLKTAEEKYGKELADEVMGENHKNIKNIIKEVLSESIIDEEAKRMSYLPETTGLFIKDLNGGYELVLYDPKEKNAYATITIFYREKISDNYFVSGVGAERGFGPFIYELAMMHINREKKGLMPARDGDVRGDAWGVWKQFYKRGDVDKQTLKLYDEDFRFDLIFGDEVSGDYREKKEWWNKMSEDERNDLIAFNTSYSMKVDKEYAELLFRAKKWVGEGFDKEIAIKAGDELWEEKYDS